MTVRRRWWIDASLVFCAIAVGVLLWTTHSPAAWFGPGLFGLAAWGIAEGRRRWPPPRVN